MKRRDFLRSAGAGLLAAGLPGGLARARKPQGFRFVHFTDLHLQPELGAEQGVMKAVEAVNRLDPAPDFVITGGDLVFDVLETSHERADMLFNLYSKCVDHFNCSVYHVIGNHDILGWYPDSGVSPEHPEYGKKMFAGRLGGGATWRSFDHKGWHFILLDSIEYDRESRDYYARINDEQVQWLREDLAVVTRDTPTVVVTHIPFFSIAEQLRSGANAALNKKIGITNSVEVLELFEGRNLQLILQGHLHRDENIRFDGRRYVMSGAVCGAWWKGPNVQTEEGFGIVDLDANGVRRCTYYDYGWEVESG